MAAYLDGHEPDEDTLRRLSGYPIAMPVRDTFYGMREVGVFEPGGNFICFAWKIK